MKTAHTWSAFCVAALLVLPNLVQAYVINFDTLTENSSVSSINAFGTPTVSVGFSGTAAASLYVGNVWSTTSPGNYLTTGINDPDFGFYLSPFFPGDVIRLDFSAPIANLSARFIITAGGPTTSPFEISDSSTGGSVNSSAFTSLDSVNGYDSWAVGFSSATPLTTVYLISNIINQTFDDYTYLLPYSFNIDDISFTADLPTPVPEPSSLLLLGAGIAGFWLIRRRRG